MTYRDGVYDITKFVQNHPGGLERPRGVFRWRFACFDMLYACFMHALCRFLSSVFRARPRILKAAGGQIDPFWAMYAQHNVASVKDILGEHRIGHLSPAAACFRAFFVVLQARMSGLGGEHRIKTY